MFCHFTPHHWRRSIDEMGILRFGCLSQEIADHFH